MVTRSPPLRARDADLAALDMPGRASAAQRLDPAASADGQLGGGVPPGERFATIDDLWREARHDDSKFSRRQPSALSKATTGPARAGGGPRAQCGMRIVGPGWPPYASPRRSAVTLDRTRRAAPPWPRMRERPAPAKVWVYLRDKGGRRARPPRGYFRATLRVAPGGDTLPSPSKTCRSPRLRGSVAARVSGCGPRCGVNAISVEASAEQVGPRELPSWAGRPRSRYGGAEETRVSASAAKRGAGHLRDARSTALDYGASAGQLSLSRATRARTGLREGVIGPCFDPGSRVVHEAFSSCHRGRPDSSTATTTWPTGPGGGSTARRSSRRRGVASATRRSRLQ